MQHKQRSSQTWAVALVLALAISTLPSPTQARLPFLSWIISGAPVATPRVLSENGTSTNGTNSTCGAALPPPDGPWLLNNQWLPSHSIRGVIDWVTGLTAPYVGAVAGGVMTHVRAVAELLAYGGLSLDEVLDDGLRVLTPVLKSCFETRTGSVLLDHLLYRYDLNLSAVVNAKDLRDLKIIVSDSYYIYDLGSTSGVFDLFNALVGKEGSVTWGRLVTDAAVCITYALDAAAAQYNTSLALQLVLSPAILQDLAAINADIKGVLANVPLAGYVDDKYEEGVSVGYDVYADVDRGIWSPRTLQAQAQDLWSRLLAQPECDVLDRALTKNDVSFSFKSYSYYYDNGYYYSTQYSATDHEAAVVSKGATAIAKELWRTTWEGLDTYQGVRRHAAAFARCLISSLNITRTSPLAANLAAKLDELGQLGQGSWAEPWAVLRAWLLSGTPDAVPPQTCV